MIELHMLFSNFGGSSKRSTPGLITTAIFSVFLFYGCDVDDTSPDKVKANETQSSVSREAELASFRQAIRAKYDMKEQAFRDNDPEPILTRFYSKDVISTDPDGNTHIGRDALRPLYNEVIGSFVRVESFNTFVNGDAGWDWVNFHVSFPPGADMEPFAFKMLFLWERIDGEWWSHGEMYVLGEFDILE